MPPATIAPSAFVPVSVTPDGSSNGALELRHGTTGLTLPVSVAPRWLAELLRQTQLKPSSLSKR